MINLATFLPSMRMFCAGKGVILLLLLASYVPAYAQGPGQQSLQDIRTHLIGKPANIPNVKRLVPTHSTNIANLTASLNEFNVDGSYKTALPVITEAEKFNAGTKYEAHRAYLQDVKNIAVLYGYNTYYPGSIPAAHSGNASYITLVYQTLKWYFAHHGTPISVYHETFNYHPYEQTTVGLLTYIGLLLFEDFHADRVSDASVQGLFDDMLSYGHHMLTDNPQSRGPNWAFRYGNCMRYVIFSDDPASMDTFVAVNDASLDFDVWADNGTDGIWPDWSLTHHGDENYWGMYGVSWLQNTLQLASLLKGTPWEYDQRQIQFIETAIYEGLQWILYKGNTEITTAPKRLTYFIDRTDVVAQQVVEQLEVLVNLHGDKLADRPQIEYLIENIDPSWESSNEVYNEVRGHKYYWHTEYQVHRRSNYSIAVRRTSMRARGPEDSSNADIKEHLHFGSGFTSILRRGDEYRLSRLGFDFQSLPGTTTELNGITNAGKSASKRRGNTVFSGGLSEGDFGVGAFEMKLGEYFPNSNSWDLVNGAGALKGNFFFSQEMVCLGQEIKRIKPGSDEIWTTLNQLQRRGELVYALGQGNPVTIGLNQAINQTLQINGTAWFWHDKVGYLIQTDAPTAIKLIGERRTLHPVLMQDRYYRDALSQEDRDLGTINMFQLAINHGADPANDRYVYKVIPDISLADFQQYSSPSVVARNSNKIQAVSNPSDSVLQLVFYEAGSLSLWGGKSVAVDKKAILMLRQSQGKLFVSVANPVHRGLTPSFVESNSPTIGELYTDPVHVTLTNFGVVGETGGAYVVPVQLPTDRGYEGQTVTELVQFRSDGGLPTDMEELGEAPLTRIYPNPHTHIIDIEPTPFMDKLEVFDLEGKQILSMSIKNKKHIRLDASLPQGTYLLKLSGKRGAETHKIVKQ